VKVKFWKIKAAEIQLLRHFNRGIKLHKTESEGQIE
jgi:hypothetical protein